MLINELKALPEAMDLKKAMRVCNTIVCGKEHDARREDESTSRARTTIFVTNLLDSSLQLVDLALSKLEFFPVDQTKVKIQNSYMCRLGVTESKAVLPRMHALNSDCASIKRMSTGRQLRRTTYLKKGES